MESVITMPWRTHCGGSGCPACGLGAACWVGANCQSGVCLQQVCAAPTCTDFVQNGDETATDCGGSCPPCATGPECTVGTDCASGVCKAEACAPARCDDNVKNGSESDVDCGQGCKLCQLNRACTADADCATGKCDNQRCVSTVRVELQAGNRDDMSVCIQPCFNLVNEGANPVELKALSIRYYYTKGSGQGAESYGCYWVNTGDCNQVAPPLFADLMPPRASANRYVELRFTDAAKPLAPGSNFVLQNGFCLTDGKAFTQSDDYSYNGSATYQTSTKVGLFKDGVRIWGDAP
ncbi:MAG: cellulose binding domain-containing protein [Myxococcales bacterium]